MLLHICYGKVSGRRLHLGFKGMHVGYKIIYFGGL